MHEVPALAGPDAGRLRLGSPGGRPDVRRRGARLPRGQAGRAFVGQAGKLLDKLLAGIGLTRSDVFVANVLKCRPPGNRDPQPDEIQACEGHLWKQIELIQPKVVATLGNFATKLLSGRPLGITRVHGQEQETTLGGNRVLLYPLYHPAAALYTPRMLEVLESDFRRLPELLGRALEPEPAAGAGFPAGARAGRPARAVLARRASTLRLVAETETSSPEETEAVAARLGGRAAAGRCRDRAGELGSGKTTFVRGACRSLGVTGPVTSPTFTIGHRYDGQRCRCRTSTSTDSPACRTRNGEISSRTSTTPSRSSSGRRPAPASCPRLAFACTCGIVAATCERSRSSVLILAFDTATSTATSALVGDGIVLGERTTTPVRVLEDVDALLARRGNRGARARCTRGGVGPGSFTGVRMGLASHVDWRSRSTFRSRACRRSPRSLPVRPTPCR